MSWRERDCGTCTFRVDDECRRFPPSQKGCNYPVIRETWDRGPEYHPACAEWRKDPKNND